MKYTVLEQEGDLHCTQTFEGSLEDFKLFYNIINGVEGSTNQRTELNYKVTMTSTVEDYAKRPFKVGDRVKVVKPVVITYWKQVNSKLDNKMSCQWVEQMDDEIGKTFTVFSVDDCISLEDSFLYLPEW